MGRHKLPYKMKKPNAHHKYRRYGLSMDPHRSEISTRTKVKYEAERIAKESYQAAKEKMDNCPAFGEYAKDFFTDKPIDKNTIISNFKKGLARAKVGEGKNLVTHSLWQHIQLLHADCAARRCCQEVYRTQFRRLTRYGKIQSECENLSTFCFNFHFAGLFMTAHGLRSFAVSGLEPYRINSAIAIYLASLINHQIG